MEEAQESGSPPLCEPHAHREANLISIDLGNKGPTDVNGYRSAATSSSATMDPIADASREGKSYPHHAGDDGHPTSNKKTKASGSTTTSRKVPSSCPSYDSFLAYEDNFLSPGRKGYSKALLAAVMGNALEFYDFSVYAFFAPEIGKLFFPKGDAKLRTVQTFGIFAGGFFMRPLGSILLGAIGDRYGTVVALRWSIVLMTLPTVMTGALPTYHQVGYLSPTLLTILRLLQGLSVGGELIGALSHTIDHTPHNQHGYWTGLVAVCGVVGNLIGSLVSVIMHRALTEAEILQWGWRIPFLAGSILGLTGILLRTQTAAVIVSSPPLARLPKVDKGIEAPSPPPPFAAPPSASRSVDTAALASTCSIGEGEFIEPILAPPVAAPAVLMTLEVASQGAATPPSQPQQQQQQKSSPFSSSLPPLPSPPSSQPQAQQQQRLSPSILPLDKKFWTVLRDAAGSEPAPFVRVIVIAAFYNSSFYTYFVWLGTYLSTLAPHTIPAVAAFGVTCILQLSMILASPFWGWVYDRLEIDRLKTLVLGVVACSIFPPLLFLMLETGRVGLAFLFAALAGNIMGFGMSGSYYAWVIESLKNSPAPYVTTATAYNLGAMAGGAYPMLASALADSRLKVAPVLPLAAWGVVVFFILLHAVCTASPPSDDKGGGRRRGTSASLSDQRGKTGVGAVAFSPSSSLPSASASVADMKGIGRQAGGKKPGMMNDHVIVEEGRGKGRGGGREGMYEMMAMSSP